MPVGGERGARGSAAGLVVLGRPGEQEPLWIIQKLFKCVWIDLIQRWTYR
jgi:hypothetical protein